MALKAVVIGSGNVAWSLAPAIDATAAVDVIQVYGRTLAKAREIVASLKNENANETATATDRIEEIRPDADIYIVTVADNAVASLAESIRTDKGGLWLHTSGGLGMEALEQTKARQGVFYPLQTFTYGRRVSFDKIPILIEGSDPATVEQIRTIAGQLSQTVVEADSEQRRRIHVAAVFACNFTNFMWTKADEILSGAGLDLSLLQPLVEETYQKAFSHSHSHFCTDTHSHSPMHGQTGPARRGDSEVMERHMGMLEGDNREIYRFLSRKIYELYHQGDKQ